MAVRFSASGQHFVTGPTGLSALTDHTMACWAKITVDRNTYSTALSLDNGTTSDYAVTQSGINGNSWSHADQTKASLASNVTVGNWYYVACAMTGVTGKLYIRLQGGGTTWTTLSLTAQATSVTPTYIRIGASPNSGEWINGAITNTKIWTSALTLADLENEWIRYQPSRTQDLLAWYPMIDLDTADLSGNGFTLTGGSGAAKEDGPTLSWTGRRRRQYMKLAGTALTASLADTLGVTDSAVRARSKALADVLGTTDSAVRARSKALADTLGVTDSAVRARSKALADVLGTTDATLIVQMLVRQYNDSLGAGDGITSALQSARGITDTAAVSDVLSSQQGRVRTSTDTVGALDAIDSTAAAARDTDNTVDFTDQINVAAAIVRLVGDGTAISDALTVSSAGQVNLTVHDQMGVVDALESQASTARDDNDFTGIIDVVAQARVLPAVEAVDVVDAIAVGGGRSVDGPVVISDSIIVDSSGSLNIAVADHVGVVDSDVTAMAVARPTVDATGISDAVTVGRDVRLNIVELISLVDVATVAALAYVTGDVLALSDTALAVVSVGSPTVTRPSTGRTYPEDAPPGYPDRTARPQGGITYRP